MQELLSMHCVIQSQLALLRNPPMLLRLIASSLQLKLSPSVRSHAHSHVPVFSVAAKMYFYISWGSDRECTIERAEDELPVLSDFLMHIRAHSFRGDHFNSSNPVLIGSTMTRSITLTSLNGFVCTYNTHVLHLSLRTDAL